MHKKTNECRQVRRIFLAIGLGCRVGFHRSSVSSLVNKVGAKLSRQLRAYRRIAVRFCSSILVFPGHINLKSFCISLLGERVPLYSYSRLSTFESCPLKYKFHYVEKMSPEEELEGIEAFLGSRVHETFEKLYFSKKLAKILPLEAVLEFFERKWRENWHEGVQVVREGFEPVDYFNLGKRMVKDYYERVFVNDDSTTIALEKRVEVDLGDGYKLQGYIDRLACSKNGFYEIHDYKTSGYLPPQRYVDADRQLALYQIGVQNDYKDAKKVKLIWHYTAFNKDLESKRTKKDIARVKKETIAVIKQIERALEKNKFPPSKSELCDWCGFRSLCPLWKHVIRAELMTENEFLRDSGVQLASKYAEWKAKEREVGDKLSQLKEAIVAFAKKEGVEVIVGKDCKISVKIAKVERLPPKGSKEREALEELLKKSGKWLQVSDLSQALLNKALEENIFDEKTVKIIEKLQKIEEESRVTVSGLSA